jgi:UDP-N-acetylglucosamine 2-epimerase (non-hydrolysing)
MKIVTILGTRPEIIKLSRVIPVLDKFSDHVVVHTGQNYTKDLKDLFFKELRLRKPDITLSTKSETTMQMVGKIIEQVDKVLHKLNPDRVLILGDTYSGLSAIVAKKMGIPVFHMEAGNRCYDNRVPEEVNRRIIDTISDVFMPYTDRSKEILLSEGYPHNKVFTIGNPIFEVLEYYKKDIKSSRILDKLNLKRKQYFTLDLHRAETVDVPEKLSQVIDVIYKIRDEYNMPVICIMHPRTVDQLKKQGRDISKKGVIVLGPQGFFDFVKLETNSFCALSDSGTIQEEGSIYKIPTVLLRDVTERHETMEVGSNFIAGLDTKSILDGIKIATESGVNWVVPKEYLKKNVSTTVARIVLSKWIL